ncbi:MAG: peptide deformylase [Candidatus Omnitrophica bacterium]|nr:peptide deformylase [Candidatus Omnitrophota bacterium]
MAVLKVVKYPDQVLQTKAKDVKQITEEDRRLVRDMIETMHAEEGVGLAANQVGALKRIFVASADQVKGRELVYLNPRIIKKQGTVKEFEGCLSIPEFYEPVRSAKKIWMKAMTLEGRTEEVKAEGLLSRIFQHEIDHLNGILFVDRLGIFKSKFAKKKLAKKLSR